MPYQNRFERCEFKYLLSPQQKDSLLQAITDQMQPDRYGRTTIRNIYFDTDSYRLIRRSVEHPAYKEKLRLRSYRRAAAGTPVFVELKKKYNAVVYKRRLLLPQAAAIDCLCSKTPLPLESQIAREIDYFCRYYQTLQPKMFLAYEREAYSCAGSDLRITMDENIVFRQTELSLDSEAFGRSILPPQHCLMEIKTGCAMPLWLAHCLSENKVYKTSFSKYGTAYQTALGKKELGGKKYA